MPWALARRRTPGLVFATFIALAGIGAACLSFGTQWAFINAFMPGIMLPVQRAVPRWRLSLNRRVRQQSSHAVR